MRGLREESHLPEITQQEKGRSSPEFYLPNPYPHSPGLRPRAHPFLEVRKGMTESLNLVGQPHVLSPMLGLMDWPTWGGGVKGDGCAWGFREGGGGSDWDTWKRQG